MKKTYKMKLLLCAVILGISVTITHSSRLTGHEGALLYAETTAVEAESSEQAVAYDDMLIKVMAVILVIWGGIAFYLFILDRKISRVEKELHEL